MDDCIVKIEKLSNGYEVEIRDGKQTMKNSKPGPYKDPWCGYAFKSVAEVVAFLEKNLDKATPAEEFESSFDAAAAEDDDD